MYYSRRESNEMPTEKSMSVHSCFATDHNRYWEVFSMCGKTDLILRGLMWSNAVSAAICLLVAALCFEGGVVRADSEPVFLCSSCLLSNCPTSTIVQCEDWNCGNSPTNCAFKCVCEEVGRDPLTGDPRCRCYEV